MLVQWVRYKENASRGEYENILLPMSYTSKDKFVAFKQLNKDDKTGDTWIKSFMAIPQDGNHVRIYHENTSEYGYIFCIGY